VVDFRPLRERNFRACCIIIFCAFGALYASSTSLPALLQSLFGYDAYHSGLVLSPSGVGSIITLIIVGRLLGRGIDARYFIAAGLLVLGLSAYWTSLLNLQVGPWEIIWPRVVLIVGLSLIFAPINVAAYMYIPRELRGAAVGLFSLLRNEGGSVGTSMAQTIQERRETFHTLRLNEFLDPYNPAVMSFAKQSQAALLRRTGDPVLSKFMSLRLLQEFRDQQASSLAYFDVFWVIGMMSFVLVFLVLLMRRSAAEKGAAIGAE